MSLREVLADLRCTVRCDNNSLTVSVLYDYPQEHIRLQAAVEISSHIDRTPAVPQNHPLGISHGFFHRLHRDLALHYHTGSVREDS